MQRTKDLYKCMFNFRRELYIKYCYAYTKEQAKILGARQVAKDQEVMPYVVLGYLKQYPDSFDIIKEIEFKEVL